MFEGWRKWRAQRRARLDLAHLDPHLLRDLGLEPGQFHDPMADRAAQLNGDPLRHRRR